jgi:hypothetical protein
MLTHRPRRARSTRRLAYPSFAAVCALLPGVLGLACGAKPPSGKTPVDADNNGIIDTIHGASLVDVNGDGKFDNGDTIDIDGNGVPEGRAVDTNGDGIADAAGIDSDGDGIIDQLDLDGDGKIDVKPDPPGAGGNASVGGSSSSGGNSAAGGSSSDGSDDLSTDGTPGAGGGGACQEFALSFTPKIPTVYVLVDRSKSMFEATDFWGKLKAAALPVLQDLQGDVRLGFGTYTGTGGTCQGLQAGAPIALNNYAAIDAAYNALDYMGSGDTPTPTAIEQARELLLADKASVGAGAGDYYILLITDGDPDFCNDPNPICPADALIASLQLTAAAGVRTLVFGIDNPQLNGDLRADGIFDLYAQAGWGELPMWDDGLDVSEYEGKMESQCKSQPGSWQALREANGNAPVAADCTPLPPEGNASCFLPAGKYGTTPATRKAFLNTDPGALGTVIRSSLESLKSCTFDLASANVEVDLTVASEGKVWVNDKDKAGPSVPADQWHMLNSTTLELLGATCDTWLRPEVTEIAADFPCEAIILK